MGRCLPPLTAALLVVIGGIVHGFWTDRWTTSAGPAEAAARLKRVPRNVDDWEGKTLPHRSSSEGIVGQLYRSYVNRVNGTEITVALFTGLPGPVSIHTPEVCYRASGFQVAAPLRYTYAGAKGQPTAVFWTADLQKTKATETLHQRIFWAWATDGAWQAAENPRVQFAAKPVLYKLYLVRELTSPDEPLEEDPCIDLMHDLLPQLQKYLFTGS
jgi:hypothetical protein